jgi:hypothetical protein
MDAARIICAEASRLLAEADGNGPRAVNLARRRVADILLQAKVVRAIAMLTGGIYVCGVDRITARILASRMCRLTVRDFVGDAA